MGHANPDGQLMEFPQRAGRRLHNRHLNDNDGFHDRYVFPGQGTVAWSGFIKALDRSEDEGPWLLEVEVRNMKLKGSLNRGNILRRTAAGGMP